MSAGDMEKTWTESRMCWLAEKDEHDPELRQLVLEALRDQLTWGQQQMAAGGQG
jgi:hypothetical protein